MSGKVSSKVYQDIRMTEMDQYLFGNGTHYEIYHKMGAHLSKREGVTGVFFAVWAPNAREVHVVGDFNSWDIYANLMEKSGEGGIWSVFIPRVEEGSLYKFVITTMHGEKLYKADPYASYAQYRPETASVVADISYHWSDKEWIDKRKECNLETQPMAVYECHIGSWMKTKTQGHEYMGYRQFADEIVAYLKKMKFTHIELMGIAEYPYDGSWGYQVTGYFAPTSRYGSPTDFKYLIDQLHKHEIGVILDWVPAHFAKDAHGLAEFDGTCIYEHPDPRLGEHPDWGTKIFNYGKNEVSNFLISNALYWIEEFHVDGLRVDAVASMLYLDYGKSDGQWVANQYGGNQNLEAIEFFKHMNSIISQRGEGAIMIAEESTAWPNVTKKAEEDGLGFDFKWNMGWMHDFCQYMKLDPYYRKDNHYGMTFAMSYNEAENYILPISHDEVVHLKCSMLEKMPGYEVDKFANLRAAYAYMFGHSGKKLLFMGQEFGQKQEWSEAKELDWASLQEPLHKGMQDYVKKLLQVYRKYPALYENDSTWAGFEWLSAEDKERSTYTFIRKPSSNTKNILFSINFTPMEWKDYVIKVPSKGKYKLILNSDESKFGGSGAELLKEVTATQLYKGDDNYYIIIDLPPYAALTYSFK